MADSGLNGTDWPSTAADALEALEILRRAYVPKNTSDAKYCLAALNVLRRELAPKHGVALPDGGRDE